VTELSFAVSFCAFWMLR